MAARIRQNMILKMISVLLVSGLILTGCSKSTEETTKKTTKKTTTATETTEMTEMTETEPEETSSEETTTTETTVPLDPERVRLAGTYEGYAIQTKEEAHPENGSINDFAIIQEGRAFRLILNEDGTASWEDSKDGNKTITEWSASGDQITIVFSDGSLSATDDNGIIKVDDSDKYWYFVSSSTMISGSWAITEAEAKVERGDDYCFGRKNTEFNPVEAIRYYTEAGNAGVGKGWYALGRYYVNFTLDDDRYSKALSYFDQAIGLGCPYGYVGKGRLYDLGNGVDKDTTMAYSLYQQAADAGCPLAYSYIALMYLNGTVPNLSAPDGKKAVEFYEKAIAGDSWFDKAHAMNALAILYEKGAGDVPSDMAKAMDWYTKAADLGYPAAICNLGLVYCYGKGVTQDYAKAKGYYEHAAKRGESMSSYELGVIYENARGVEKDYATALQYYQQALERGYYQASYKIGLFYDNGFGVEVDYAKAMDYFMIGVKENYHFSFGAVAYMYSEGHGVEVDYDQAFSWNSRGAELRNPQSASNLGWAYHNGKGAERNGDMALQWYTKAIIFAKEQGTQGTITYAQNAIAKLVEQGLITQEQADAALATT